MCQGGGGRVRGRGATRGPQHAGRVHAAAVAARRPVARPPGVAVRESAPAVWGRPPQPHELLPRGHHQHHPRRAAARQADRPQGRRYVL